MREEGKEKQGKGRKLDERSEKKGYGKKKEMEGK